MPKIQDAYTVAALFCLTWVLSTLQARATGLPNLDQFVENHGNYAPGGDCNIYPSIMVDGNGLSVENGEARYKFERFHHAANFGGRDYSGISVWLMPLYGIERPLLLTFNSGEQPGVVTVEPYDRGWPGGPPLSARHQRLVDASPYRKCEDMPEQIGTATDPS